MAQAARLSAPPAGAHDWIVAGAPVPFEELLVDTVDDAIGLLQDAAGRALDCLSPAALTVLRRALLVRLSDIALATFASEFALYRALRQPLPGAAAIGNAAYRRFVAAGPARTFMHYPALSALVERVCRSWAAGHGEMLVRLHADWPDIRRRFGPAAPRPLVASLWPYRSDPHHDGRALTLLGFADGLVLVHKPRSVAMEGGLDALLCWANRQGFSHPLRRPALLGRKDYGWMEHVAAAPCRTVAELTAFYHRIGGLIALITLFQGTDIHQENLIAAGAQPVIVDAETLVHPRIDPAFAEALGPGAGRYPRPKDVAQALDDSGFFARAGEPDFSSLGAAGPVETPFPQPRCTGINGDALAVERMPYRAAPQGNVPVLDGVPQQASDHADVVLAGYAEMIGLAIADCASLLETAERFAGCATRVIMRSTNAYGLVLNASLAPAMLRDEAAREALFARLSSAAAGPTQADILGEERRALRRLDVPHLTRPCDVAGPGWPSPLAQVRARIAGLQASDLAGHLALLRDRLQPPTRGERA